MITKKTTTKKKQNWKLKMRKKKKKQRNNNFNFVHNCENVMKKLKNVETQEIKTTTTTRRRRRKSICFSEDDSNDIVKRNCDVVDLKKNNHAHATTHTMEERKWKWKLEEHGKVRNELQLSSNKQREIDMWSTTIMKSEHSLILVKNQQRNDWKRRNEETKRLWREFTEFQRMNHESFQSHTHFHWQHFQHHIHLHWFWWFHNIQKLINRHKESTGNVQKKKRQRKKERKKRKKVKHSEVFFSEETKKLKWRVWWCPNNEEISLDEKTTKKVKTMATFSSSEEEFHDGWVINKTGNHVMCNIQCATREWKFVETEEQNHIDQQPNVQVVFPQEKNVEMWKESSRHCSELRNSWFMLKMSGFVMLKEWSLITSEAQFMPFHNMNHL